MLFCMKSILSIFAALYLLTLCSCNPSSKQTEHTVAKDDSLIKPDTLNQSIAFPNNVVTDLGTNVISIYQDSKENYWFGTQTSGVFRYDGKQLIQFTMKDGLSDNQIQSIQEDETDTIWFGTGGFGISKFDGVSITSPPKLNEAQEDWQTEPGELWLNANDGAYRIHANSISHYSFTRTESGTGTSNSKSLGPQSAYCLLKDQKGIVWFGTQSSGVGYYNPSEIKSDTNPVQWLTDKGLAGPAVLALFEDHTGTLWFGNNGSGLFRYDGKTLVNFTREKGLSNDAFRKNGKSGPGTLARIYAINEDTQGNLWIGTADAGVWRFDGENLTNFTMRDGLPNNAVSVIYKDKKGELWFGTEGSGVCKFNGTRFTTHEFQLNETPSEVTK